MMETSSDLKGLIALRSFIYNGRALEAGDEFDPESLGGVPPTHLQRLQRRRRIGPGRIVRTAEELVEVWAHEDDLASAAAIEAQVEALSEAEQAHFETLDPTDDARVFLDAPPEERAVQMEVGRRLRWQAALEAMEDEDEQAYFRGAAADAKEAYLAMDDETRLEILTAWMEREAEKEDDGEGGEGPADPVDPPAPVGFDPARHTIEHRGGGSYFIIEDGEKVGAAMTKEEAEALQAPSEDTPE